MESRRALRILGTRWWVVLLAAAVGAGAAFAFTTEYNRRIEPDFEATAPVAFEQFNDSDAAFASRLSTAAVGAREALAAELAVPGRGLETDTESGELQFIARASNAAEAMAAAGALRAAYLVAEPSASNQEQISAELERLEEEIIRLRGELAADSEVMPMDPVVEAQRSLLAAQIGSLEQRAASLTLQLTYPDLAEGEVSELQAEFDLVESLLQQLTTGLAELPAAVPTTQPGLDTIVVSRRLSSLEEDYVTLALRLLDESAQGGRLDPLRMSDLTAAPISRIGGAAAGLVAGALLAVLALLFLDGIRRPIRSLDDVQAAQPLGVVARARPGAGSRRPWYPTASTAPRRRQVQAIRTALDRLQGPFSVGITGLAVHPGDLQSLAGDLAASFASSGRRVLLVDANLDRPSTLPEYGSEPPDLTDLITQNEGEDARALIKRALSDRPEVLSNLAALRAGGGLDDPVEALAGRSFRHLMEAAAELEEIIVMALPPARHLVTDLLSQRLTHILVMIRKQKATQPALEAVIRGLADRNAEVLGAVLLEGRHEARAKKRPSLKGGSRRQRLWRKPKEPNEHHGTAPEPGPRVDAGKHTPGRDETNALTALPTGGLPELPTPTGPGAPDPEGHVEASRPARPIAEDTAPAQQRRQPALRIDPSLPARASIDRRSSIAQSSTSVVAQTADESDLTIVVDDRSPPKPTPSRDELEIGERYLVDRVLMLLGFSPTEAALKAGLVDAEGIIPVSPQAGSATAAERLTELLRHHDPDRSPYLDDLLTAVLMDGPSENPIQYWIERKFFETHQRLTGGRPDVWHLTSPQGAFQVLVRGDSFDADQVALLRSHDVRRTLNSLARRAADTRANGRRIDEIKRSRLDVQAFEESLAELIRERWPASQAYDPSTAFRVLVARGLVADRLHPPEANSS